jgi:outer membrane protein assembly factor BamB
MVRDRRTLAPQERRRPRTRALGWQGALPLALLVMTVAACSSAAGPVRDSGSGTVTNSATASQSPAPRATRFSARGGGVLVAVDARTGQQRWRTELPMASVSEPVVRGGLVVLAGTSDCDASRLTVAAVRADTGRPAWQSAVAARNLCAGDSVQVADGTVVAGGPLGDSADLPGLCAGSGAKGAGPAAVGLDLATGVQRWQAPQVAGGVLGATSDTVIARGANPGCLVGLDSASGGLRWKVVLPLSQIFSMGVADSAFVLGQAAGGATSVTALDAGTGRKGWRVALPPAGSVGPLVVGDVVITWMETMSQSYPSLIPGSPKAEPPPPTRLTTVIVLDPATGHQLWRADEHDDQIWTSVGPGLVLVTHLNGDESTVEAIESRTGVRRWQSAALRSGVGARTDGAVVIALPEGSATAFTAAEGRPLWTVSGAYTAAAVTADTVYLVVQTIPKNPPQGGG